MLTKTDKIKCDNCGKFISFDDLMDGKARHTMVLPSSEYSDETFESTCQNCLEKDKL